MRNFNALPAAAYMQDFSRGLSALGVSVRWATGRSIFKGIFSRLAQYDYEGWATLEWECCLKSGEAGAREGAKFISDHIIPVAEHAFDDFAQHDSDIATVQKTLGLEGGR